MRPRMQMEGIYNFLSFLSRRPMWEISTILLVLVVVVIPLGRLIFQGKWFQVSFSAFPGEACLAGVLLIAVEILHKVSYTPMLFNHRVWLQWVVYISSVLLGVMVFAFTMDEREAEIMDFYHDIVVAPLFLSGAILLLPVIWFNGSQNQLSMTIFLISCWIVALLVDIDEGRLNQPQWLREHYDVRFRRKEQKDEM